MTPSTHSFRPQDGASLGRNEQERFLISRAALLAKLTLAAFSLSLAFLLLHALLDYFWYGDLGWVPMSFSSDVPLPDIAVVAIVALTMSALPLCVIALIAALAFAIASLSFIAKAKRAESASLCDLFGEGARLVKRAKALMISSIALAVLTAFLLSTIGVYDMVMNGPAFQSNPGGGWLVLLLLPFVLPALATSIAAVPVSAALLAGAVICSASAVSALSHRLRQ